MSVINPISPNIFNAEFLNSPAAAVAAWLSIAGVVITLVTMILRALFKYRKSHDEVLKKSGIPPFVLNFFLIQISLKKLPAVSWIEKFTTVVFWLIFLMSAYFFGSALIQTTKTPPEYTLLYWKNSGESFFMSNKVATEATVFSVPAWEISKDDCMQTLPTNIEKYNALTIDHKEVICRLLTTDEGKAYVKNSVKRFVKDKLFIYSIIPTIILFLLWISSSLVLTNYYSKRVRKYILTEQKNAIQWVKGEFKVEGVYLIYQELEPTPRR